MDASDSPETTAEPEENLDEALAQALDDRSALVAALARETQSLVATAAGEVAADKAPAPDAADGERDFLSARHAALLRHVAAAATAE